MHDSVTNSQRILQITGMDCKKYGGIERHLLLIAQAAARMGYSHIIQYETPPRSQAYLNDLKRENISVIASRTNGTLMPTLYNLNRLLSEIKPTIVHLHFTPRYLQILIPYLSKIHGVKKLVASVHNPFEKKVAKKILYGNCDVVIATSPLVARSVSNLDINIKKPVTHYIGVHNISETKGSERNRWRRQLKLPPNALVIGCIAFDANFKGNDILLEACKRLFDRFKDVYLLNIGVDPNTSSLTTLATDLGISQRVRWAGIIDNEWELLNAVDIYIQPSRGESAPLAVAEAMFMKVPVIMTNAIGISELFTNSTEAMIVEPENSDEIANAAEDLILNKDKRIKIGEAGFAKAVKKLDAVENARIIAEDFYSIHSQ